VGSELSPAAATHGFQHIHLFVSDLERSVRFYTRAFGMRVAFRGGDSMTFLNTPGTLGLVTLHQVDVAPDVDRGGVWHFGFFVAAGELGGVVKQAVEAGGQLADQG
jgi:catechol 2,3-dioxygenase-like lactoylglutathione lyase family enzyme